MRASTAFLVGVGTVGLAISGGLGGGLLIGNMMSPSPPKHAAEAAHIEQPKSEQPQSPPPMPAAGALPYAGATLAFTDPSIDGSPPQPGRRADSGTASSAPATVSAAVPPDQEEKHSDSVAARQPKQEPQQASSGKQPSTQEDTYAKANDSDLKHAADKRRAERAKRWADRRHHDENQDQPQSSDSDQQARNDRDSGGSAPRYTYDSSDRRYRDDRGGRYRDAERGDADDRAPSYYVDEAPRFGFPRIQLFGPDD